MEKNRVRLNICGADYSITTEDDPKYVMALGDELDAALTKTLRENSRLSVTQAAILAALEYADMYKMDLDKVKAALPEKELVKDLRVKKASDFVKENAKVTFAVAA